MKIFLVSAILLLLTGCGISSAEETDQQRSLIEYESCLRMQEDNRLIFIDELSKREGAIPDAVLENFVPDKKGKIFALESALKNCERYRP